MKARHEVLICNDGSLARDAIYFAPNPVIQYKLAGTPDPALMIW